jgi:hypothetical protein
MIVEESGKLTGILRLQIGDDPPNLHPAICVGNLSPGVLHEEHSDRGDAISGVQASTTS